MSLKNLSPGADEIAQQVKMLAARIDDLTLFPRTQNVENQPLEAVLWPPYVRTHNK